MKIVRIFTFVISIAFISSCTETWNEHYNVIEGERSELNIAEYIKSQPDLSTFSKMLEISGYDSILSKSQTYTVWTPTNSALTNIDLNDTVAITELVENHITRFNNTTSGLQTKTIMMLSKKFVLFKREGTEFFIGNCKLHDGQYNKAVSNGTIHLIDSYMPYLSNIWEFIRRTPGLDSLWNYLNSQSTYEFDLISSVEIGTNEYGQSVYDSVINFSNPVLDKIGQLQLEDSSYMAILPDNAAWIKAYNKIKDGYKTYGTGGEILQRLNTNNALVNNLIFRDLVSDPASVDSITSTTGSKFNNPSYLFDGAQKYDLSNGIAWISDSLRFKAADTWQKSIKIEAENSDYGRTSVYSDLSVLSSLGSVYNSQISDSKFLVVKPNTVSLTQKSAVTFPIPNTLSGAYNIYCVFVPSEIASETDTKPYRVSFSLSFRDAKGNLITDAVVTSTHGINTNSSALPAAFTTTKSEITKMFVAKYTFPWCNLIADKSESANINVKLKVQSEALITQMALYNRIFRIDYIVLEAAE